MFAIANPCLVGRWFSRAGLGAALALVAAAASAAINLPDQKDTLAEIGRQHRTALDLYKDFEKQANGGQKLNFAQMPDCIAFDYLSNCAPPGHPRWMTEPFLRDNTVIQTDNGSSQFRDFTFDK